ncbi:MAG: reactive intermediate/imine deaminase [Bdellovibrionales bacterium GWA2_49_15]|nr:MAG: reactive intermediate/imine deaminase [Bdellovibrionales bacterium GWA2_49_15]
MKKAIVQTDLAPKAIGPYSQGVRVGDFFFFSGQIGLEPATGDLKKGFDEQLEQVLSNIDGLLKSEKLSHDNVIKSTIFMTDLGQFAKVNTAYENFFRPPYPARSTVQVAALPKGAVIEIEVIAVHS